MTDDLLVAYAAADACHSTLARLLLQAVRDARNPRNGSCVRARHFLLESEELLLALDIDPDAAWAALVRQWVEEAK